MRITKHQMAKVIIAALYNLPYLPADDDRRVIKRAKAKLSTLENQHAMAIKVLEARPDEAKAEWRRIHDERYFAERQKAGF